MIRLPLEPERLVLHELVAQDAVPHRRVAILSRPHAVLLLHRPRLVSDTGVRSGR